MAVFNELKHILNSDRNNLAAKAKLSNMIKPTAAWIFTDEAPGVSRNHRASFKRKTIPWLSSQRDIFQTFVKYFGPLPPNTLDGGHEAPSNSPL